MRSKPLKIVASKEFEQEVDEITEHLMFYSPRAATRTVTLIIRRAQMLALFPDLGERQPQFGPDVRRIGVGKYQIYYKSLSDRILLLRILHGARDIKSLN